MIWYQSFYSSFESSQISILQNFKITMTSIVEVTTHTHFPIILTVTNFPVWRKQVVATLTRLGLDGYIKDSIEAPPKVMSTDNTKSNPTYILWFRQDQIILGALLGSYSETIQPIVLSVETAQQAFKTPN